jgi:cell division protein FtsB
LALNFRPYVRLTILGGLIVYFGAQALTGERGLLNEAERREALIDRRAELARLEAERSELQARVDGLSAEHLSVDLLEERARVVLGFSGPGDYVIRDTSAS